MTDERDGRPSASSMERRVFCPGSQRAESEIPEPPESDVATAGTEIHEAMETGDTSELGETEAEIAERLKAAEDEIVSKWREDSGITGIPSMFREERAWVRNWSTFEPVASAKKDVVYVDGSRALAIDFKTGFKSVQNAGSNWQLRTQALAAWHEYMDRRKDAVVRVAIAQSRLGTEISQCEYGPDDLVAAEQTILRAIWMANQPDAHRNAGNWCRYCRAKASCPQAAAFSLLVLQSEGKELSPQDLRTLWASKATIDSIIADAVAKLKEMPAEQLASLKLKLKPTGDTITITDPEGLRNAVLEANLATEEEWASVLKVQLGALEKLVVPKLVVARKLSKKAAEATFDDFIASFRVKKPKAKTIAEA